MRSAGDGVTPPAPGDAAGDRPTQLLPVLLDRFEAEQPLTVLDVGQGVGDTVRFFSRFRCRLHFAGLYDLVEQSDPPEDQADAYFDDLFIRGFRFPADTRFDVCLLWDFLNYLPVPAVGAFSAALRPYLHRGTLAHGFGSFKANAPALSVTTSEPHLYGVGDVDRLTVRPRPGGRAPAYPHSRRVLADSLTCFEIGRGTLLKDGTMELLLEAR